MATAANTFTVTSATDDGTGSTPGTLSYAILQANTAAAANPAAQIAIDIALAGGATTLALSAATPAIFAPTGAGGSLTINGSGTPGLTIDGSGNTANSRAFFVEGGTVAIENMTIANAKATGGAGADGGGGGLGAGAAIFVNAGTTSVTNVGFSDDTATGGTGAAAARADLPADGDGALGGGGGGLGGNGGFASGGGGGGGGYSGGGGGGGSSGSYSTQPGGAGGMGPGGNGGNGGNQGQNGQAGADGGGDGGQGSDNTANGAPSNGGGGGGGGLGGGRGGNSIIPSATGSGGGTSSGGPGAGGGGGGGLEANSGGVGESYDPKGAVPSSSAGSPNGGVGGGGGGGAALGGGNGGDFGGGGGSGDTGVGSGGGFGGGGGGGEVARQNGNQASGFGFVGGIGGFGGGGGGGGDRTVSYSTSTMPSGGGIGGGIGGLAQTGTTDLGAGGGGAAFGGAVFVRQGANLVVITTGTANSAFSGDGVTGGAPGTGGNAGSGVAAGSDLFLQTGATTTLAPAAGTTLTLNGTVADDSASSVQAGKGYTSGTGSGAGLTIGTAGQSGTVVFANTAAASYSGPTTVSYGTLKGEAQNAFSANSTIADSSTLDLGGFDQAIGGLSGGSAGVVTNSGQMAATLTTGGLNGSSTFAGTIEDGVHSSATGLTKVGTGIQTLTGTNTYTGGTSLDAGELDLGSNAALGTGALAMAAGTALGFAANGLTVSNAISLSGDPTIDVEPAQSPETLSGTISDGSSPGFLEKTGAGTLILSGQNTYTGGTTLDAGALDLDAATTMNGNGAITSAAAGTGAIAFGTAGPATLKVEAVALTTSGTASTLANAVSGFTIAGDAIDFAGLQNVGAVSAANGALTLTSNTGATDSVTLTDAGLAAGQRYVAEGDGAGGTEVLVANGAPTFTVTSNGDTAGDTSLGSPATATAGPSGTLREALNFANANPGTTIQFANGLGPIYLQADLPLVAQSTTITGAADGSTVIDGRPSANGAATYRGFLISGIAADGQNAAATTVGISNLTIQNVKAQGGNGADGGGGGLGAGGAVFVGPAATVTLTNVDVSNANATGGVGANYTQSNFGGGGGGLAGSGGSDNNGGNGSGGGGGGILFDGGNSPASGDGGGGGGGISGVGGTTTSSVGGAGGPGLATPNGTVLGGGGGGGGSVLSNSAGGTKGGTGASDGYSGRNNMAQGGGGGGGFGGGSGGAYRNTGSGGFGGGGGGAGQGGTGGFGGGGGGGSLSGGTGGFGGGGGEGGSSGFGATAASTTQGGNGAGLGGAIFVAYGGSLTIAGTSTESDGSASQGSGGTGFGGGIFFEGSPTNGIGSAASVLTFGAGNQTISDAIADLGGSGGTTAADGFTQTTGTTTTTLTGGVTALAKTGTGALTLGGTNTYTGGTTLAAGTIAVSADDNLGASAGGLTFTGGTLESTASFATARAVALTGAGTFAPAAGTALTESGLFSGSGVLTQDGAGTLDLTDAANSYSGGTALDAGTLELGTQTSAGTGDITFGAGTQALQLDAALTAGATTLRNTLDDLGAGDTIDVRGLSVTGATVSYANGVLTVANGATSENFILGTPSAMNFSMSSDGAGGTLVTDNAAGTPTANPQTDQVAFNTSKAITLTGSDAEDNPPQPLTYAVATAPAHGTLSGTAPNLTYTPTTGFYGPDSFTFTDSNGQNTSNPATVTLDVAAGTPTITNTHAKTDMAEAPVKPFAASGTSPAVTVSDPNTTTTGGAATPGDTLTIALSGGGGSLADGTGYTTGNGTLKQTVAGTDGTYTLSGTAGAITAELDALTFTPINTSPGAPAITTFALTDASSAGASSRTDTGTIVTDESVPLAPSTPRLTAATDTGVSNSDEVTNDATPTFTGTAQAGATVTIYDNGTAIGTQTLTGGATAYVIQATSSLVQGSGNSVTARQTVAGVQSPSSGATAVTLDTVTPTITTIADSGPGIDANGNGDLGTGKTVTLTVTTSEPVYVIPGSGGGTPTLTLSDGATATYTGLTNAATSTLTFSYTVVAGQNTAKLAVTQVNANGATVTDQAGNPISTSLMGAMVPSGTLTVDTTPPTASSPTLTVAQNAGATPIGIGAPTDNLTPAGGLAIAASSLPTDGTVTLADGTTVVTAGEALTAAQVTGLEFTPTPGVSGQGSTFTYTVTDGAGNATQGTAALNVGAAGAPTITGTHATTTTSEAPVAPFSGVTVADPSSPAGATETLTIAPTGAGGTLADGAGYGGLTRNANGTYALTGSAANVSAELDALTFTPTAGAAGTTSNTTFVLTDASSSGASVTDAGTSVADTDPAAPVQPSSPPTTDTVSISPLVSYKDGVFTLTGTASSTAGVKSVEISAVENYGARVDLGAAAVNADGSFTFQDRIGANLQGFLQATETDDAGGTATSADPLFSLTGGLGPDYGAGRQRRYTADGEAFTAKTLFSPDGVQTASVTGAGQTFASAYDDTFNNAKQADTSFVFDPGFSLDVVNGFRVRGDGHDTLSFKGSDFGTTPQAQLGALLASSYDAGGSLYINDPTSGDAVQLKGITKAQLVHNERDIMFHA